MCGHVGLISNKITADHIKWFEQALYVDALRGWDSTGVCIVPEAKISPIVLKKALMAPDFMDTRRYTKFMRNALTSKVLMGHNRAATKGLVTNQAAHPFTHDHITLAHNGTLWGHSTLHGGHHFEVDSEAVCYSIAKVGLQDTIDEMCGAYALVWYDSEKGTVSMLKNEDRPFHYARVKGEDTIIYASELCMLEFLAARNHMTLDEACALAPNTLATIDLSSTIKDVELTEAVPAKKYWQKGTSTTSKSSTAISPKEAGYPEGRVEFVVNRFASYVQQDTRGNVKGDTLDYNYYEVDAYGISASDIEVGAVYEGVIIKVYRNDASYECRIIVNPLSIKLLRSSEEQTAHEKKRLADAESYTSQTDTEDGITDDVIKEALSGDGNTWEGFVSYNGVWQPLEEVMKIVSSGCCSCREVIPEEDIPYIIEYEGEPLCLDCTNVMLGVRE